MSLLLEIRIVTLLVNHAPPVPSLPLPPFPSFRPLLPSPDLNRGLSLDCLVNRDNDLKARELIISVHSVYHSIGSFIPQMHCSVVPTHCLAICAALILTVVLLAMVGPATGQPSTPDTKDGQTYGQIIRRVRSLRSKYYCGHQIVQILSLLCDGNYHGPSKRNGQSADDTKQNQLNNGQ